MKSLKDIIAEKMSINEGRNEIKLALVGNDIVKDIQNAIQEIASFYNQELGVHFDEREIQKQKQELINYTNKFFEFEPEDHDLPIIGATYEDNNGNHWKVEAYCSLDDKKKSSNVRNLKEMIRHYDDSGMMQDYLDEYGKDLKKDTIFVGVSHVKGSPFAGTDAVLEWGEHISSDSLIKR